MYGNVKLNIRGIKIYMEFERKSYNNYILQERLIKALYVRKLLVYLFLFFRSIKATIKFRSIKATIMTPITPIIAM